MYDISIMMKTKTKVEMTFLLKLKANIRVFDKLTIFTM